jgi:hypothetical protein
MKKNKTKTVWWSGLTAEDMNNISKKKSPKKSQKEKSVIWGNEYSDVDRSPKKSKKSKRKIPSQ